MKKSKLFSVMCSSVLAAALFTDCIVPLNDRSSVRAEETSSAAIAYEDDYCSGDINGDGVINIFDFSRLNRYLEGNLEFDTDQLKAADFNYDRSVDEGDLADMSGFITMYSEMPVNYHRRRLILNAKNFFLKYGETTDIELSIKIPDDWEKNDITVTGDGEKIAVIPFSSLTEGEKCERDGYSYTEYTVSVPVPDQGDNDTRGFSVDLIVQMNGQESYPVMLNRAVKDAKERIEKSGELMKNLSDYASQLPTGSSKEEVLSEMRKWIEANPDLEITDVSSDIINFQTSYGINSFFEIEEVSESNENGTESLNTNETVIPESPVENIATVSAFDANNLYKTTDYDDDYDELLNIYHNTPKEINSSCNNLTLLDPDVLLHAPCDNNYVISGSLEDMREIGTDLANNILKWGQLNSHFDEFVGNQHSNFSDIEKWNQYGTVFWFTHANNMKVNGWDRTYYEMYECDAKYDIINKALSLRDSLNGISQFDIDNNSYMPDLSIGVTYVFEKHSGCYKLAVGSGAVMQVLSQTVFPNTIFYFIACKGASDHIFNKFLLDHGAAGVIGFDKTSRNAMSIPIAKKTFEHAFDELPGSNWKTLQDAHLEANIKANLNPVNAIETVFANVRCALDYSSTADYYAEKYFYYRGYGTISANICVHDEDDNLIVRDPDDTRYRVDFYRYSNNGLLHGYGGVFNGCNNGITDFSYTVDYGSYLIQFVDAYNDAETFIRTDLTDRRLDLGQIIIIEKTDLFKFVYNSYLNLYGKAPSDSEVNKWKQALKDKSINAALMLKSFYTDNLNAIVDMDNRSWALKAYSAFVGKAPDETKRKELEIIALSGQSHENIAKYIVESNDFKNRCAELNILPGEWLSAIQKNTEDNENEIQQDDLYQYVYNCYSLFEGKAPSDNEVNNLKSKLEEQTLTAATMVNYFSANKYVMNKMDSRSWALNAYSVLVGKAPDDAKRKELDMIASSGQSHENIAKYIIESDDFKNRCNELNILPGEW